MAKFNGDDIKHLSEGTLMVDVLKLVRGTHVLTPIPEAVASELFTFIGTVSVASTTKNFVAAEKFVVNVGEYVTVNISAISMNFKTWFLKKIEPSCDGRDLSYHDLVRYSNDTLIISGLGGEKKAETTLTKMFSLMEKQGHGQKGALLTSGGENIFYIPDVNGVLRVAYVFWCRDGWEVRARPVAYPGVLVAVSRVFFGNSDTV